MASNNALDAVAAADPLSPRETAVLRGLADGLTGKCIARRLNIAPGTVADHKKALFRKLGVRTAAGAVGAGFRAGVVE